MDHGVGAAREQCVPSVPEQSQILPALLKKAGMDTICVLASAVVGKFYR